MSTIVDSVIINNYLDDVKNAINTADDSADIADHVPPEDYPKIIEKAIKNASVKSIVVGDEHLTGDVEFVSDGDAHFNVISRGENNVVGINIPLVIEVKKIASEAKETADIALASVTWDDSE